jgi:hypothetical protein
VITVNGMKSIRTLFRTFLKRVARQLAVNDGLWHVASRSVVAFGAYLERERGALHRSRCHDANTRRLRSLGLDSASLVVQAGPFVGLTFPETALAFGPLCLQIIGSFEMELHPTLDLLFDRPYERIINVGAAEGYYACGLARRFLSADVIAFEVDGDARDVLVETVYLNNLGQRTRVLGMCLPERLVQAASGIRALIVCDCEGGERFIFSDDVVDHLRNADLLVEVHDGLDSTISATLMRRFSPSHRATWIAPLGAHARAGLHSQRYALHAHSGLSLGDFAGLLAENRRASTGWVLFERTGGSGQG